MAEENKGVYFTELKLSNIRCFGEDAVLKLSNEKGEWQRWTVILGDNGTGKTTLLQCLAGMELIEINGNEIDTYRKKTFRSKIDFVFHGNLFTPLENTIYYAIAKINLYGKNLEVGFKEGVNKILDEGRGFSSTSYPLIVYDININEFFILGYGANRAISYTLLSEKELNPDNSATLFDDDAKLINAEEWLYQMDYAASRVSEIQQQAIKRRDLILDTLQNILLDIEERPRFTEATNISNPMPKLEFKTPYGWVGLKQLSYGYKTMVAWVIDVAARMFNRYPDSDNPLAEPVVILVDEIDLHLHPKWQRKIFDYLGERFPRAQFIVTAHSPLIVQSAPKDANVVVLRKEPAGEGYVVKIDNSVESVRNWRIDQIITSDLFDIPSARSPEVEYELAERTSLLKKKELTPEEQQRLEKLNNIASELPTADNKVDREAMDIIRKAALFIKDQRKAS